MILRHSNEIPSIIFLANKQYIFQSLKTQIHTTTIQKLTHSLSLKWIVAVKLTLHLIKNTISCNIVLMIIEQACRISKILFSLKLHRSCIPFIYYYSSLMFPWCIINLFFYLFYLKQNVKYIVSLERDTDKQYNDFKDCKQWLPVDCQCTAWVCIGLNLLTLMSFINSCPLVLFQISLNLFSYVGKYKEKINLKIIELHCAFTCLAL